MFTLSTLKALQRKSKVKRSQPRFHARVLLIFFSTITISAQAKEPDCITQCLDPYMYATDKVLPSLDLTKHQAQELKKRYNEILAECLLSCVTPKEKN